MTEPTDEEILADELAEQEWYKKQKEINNSLFPCLDVGKSTDA
jgi:hypothetical protein